MIAATLFNWLPAVVGTIAQSLATYLLLRTRFEKRLPRSLLVEDIKLFMCLTLTLWFLSAVLGAITYFVWYVA